MWNKVSAPISLTLVMINKIKKCKIIIISVEISCKNFDKIALLCVKVANKLIDHWDLRVGKHTGHLGNYNFETAGNELFLWYQQVHQIPYMNKVQHIIFTS